MTAERITTTGTADADVVAEPAVAPSGATATTVSPPPAPTEPGATGPAAADPGKDRDKTNRRKAAASAEPPPAAFGGLPPPVEPVAAAGPATAAADAEAEALAAPAASIADPEATARPAGAADPAPAARSRPPQAAPAKTSQSGPPPPATAAPATQSSPATGGGAAPGGIPALPMLPLLPSAAQPTSSPTGTTGSADAPTGTAAGGTSPAPTVAPSFSRTQEILDVLIILESMLGSGGMQMPGFRSLESALQPSMGSGAAAAAEYDLATFQQNEAGAFNILDKELTGVLDALAGDNATYQGDMRGIVLDVDARLAMLGPYAYTSAGQQQVAAILDSALTSALQICHSSQAQSVLAAAMIDELAKGYLGGLAQSGSGSGGGSSAAALAEKYLGWYESQLQGEGVDQAAPYGESCADFVSSMLNKAGLINWHTNLVSGLASQLPAQGWTQVSLANAKPGDVWICNGASGESHTEIVASNSNGHVTLIGSNNVSSDMQRVSYDSYSASIPGSYILAPP